MKLDELDPYYEGVMAFRDGFPVSSNPYPSVRSEAHKWYEGYHTRRMEQALNDYRQIDVTNDEARFRMESLTPAAPQRPPEYYYGYYARMQYLEHGVKCIAPMDKDQINQWTKGYYDANRDWKEKQRGESDEQADQQC